MIHLFPSFTNQAQFKEWSYLPEVIALIAFSLSPRFHYVRLWSLQVGPVSGWGRERDGGSEVTESILGEIWKASSPSHTVALQLGGLGVAGASCCNFSLQLLSSFSPCICIYTSHPHTDRHTHTHTRTLVVQLTLVGVLISQCSDAESPCH